tara:strand:+ start:1598 stop:2173 length:576 start_codon:yes stop_codon:yes gene_type:complete
MSSSKYLLFFFLTSCSLSYFSNTNIKEKQSSNLQITESFNATGTFTYFKENATIKGKINLISDSNDNLWISANSLFNIELFRIVLKDNVLYLINRVEKNYQTISFNDLTKNVNENIYQKIKSFENTELAYLGTRYSLLFSEINNETHFKKPQAIIVKKGDQKDILFKIIINTIQSTNQKIKINIPESYEKI